MPQARLVPVSRPRRNGPRRDRTPHRATAEPADPCIPHRTGSSIVRETSFRSRRAPAGRARLCSSDFCLIVADSQATLSVRLVSAKYCGRLQQICSLPPCVGGLGRGGSHKRNLAREPPPPTPPRKGEGRRKAPSTTTYFRYPVGNVRTHSSLNQTGTHTSCSTPSSAITTKTPSVPGPANRTLL